MNKETSIGAIVFKKLSNKFRFLILRRRDNSIWEFPKGHIKTDESEYDTLKRELSEELGIKEYDLVKDFREEISYVSSRNVVRKFVFYLLNWDGAIKESEEHIEHKWITLEEASEYFEHKDIIRLLKKAEKTIHEGI